jgi:hypothetical protein
MTNPPISTIHRYSSRFLRSTDLVRDFHDPKGLDGYALTNFARSCLTRISDGLRIDSSRRAWRLTGDFGSGKSSFALLLANSLRGGHEHLPKHLREDVLAAMPIAKRQHYITVLVCGSREPISTAILRSLLGVLEELYTRGAKSALEHSIGQALKSKNTSSQEALELIDEANAKVIQTGKGDGLLLILDEVGKFLEYAALNPEEQDIFFLQQLAEKAARSGKHPLFVVCLLHQGFNAYAEQLAQTTQREWAKVADRFDEILFQQPLDQIAFLVASAIDPETTKIPSRLTTAAESVMKGAIKLGWYGTSAGREALQNLPARLFPLDPTVLPVLVRVFQRFGQNERSLFSFLCSHEPFGLRAFAQQDLNEQTRPYQLADFYDYVRTNFGHRLGVVSYRTHWNVIESTIETHNASDPLELRVLKTVGILNLISADDLRPTNDAVALAVAGDSSKQQAEVAKLLARLTGQRYLHFRGETRGYSLWPYTSVDIDTRLEEAKRVNPHVPKISQAIADELDTQPIVARAHYIRSGNLRYFDVVYCRPNELTAKAGEYQTSADGFILVPLCETEIESKTCKAIAKDLPERGDLIRLIAVPRALSHLNQSALDALRWEWVQSNTPELNNDRFAREEVQVHLHEARNRLRTQIQLFLGLNRINGQSSLTWFYFDSKQLKTFQFRSGRQALHLLSTLCDGVYHRAPQIKNELVNRHNLSSAATAARMRLVELMFTHGDKVELGLPPDRRPPEKSMYLSVLQQAGLHRLVNGTWAIGEPINSDPARVKPVLHKIKALLVKQPDTRLPVSYIIEQLRRPPFGIRNGLFPILLAVIAIQDEQEIAFYEDGTFLRDVGRDAFLRMTRAPEKFEIQFCKIEGVRSELFQRLFQLLELPGNAGQNVELLDVVRSLCQFVAQLPDYVRNTKRLTSTAIAVRTVILDAREPIKMVFHDLPQACGLAKFEVGKPVPAGSTQKFVLTLKEALDEMRATFFNLQRRMADALKQEFACTGQVASQYRHKITARAERLLVQVTENKLKAFAFRLFDSTSSEPEWLESVGSVLALRPPNKWKDEDEDTFLRELEALCGRFKRAESAAFGRSANGEGSRGLRVAVTQADGSEREEVIHIDAAEEDSLLKLQEQISRVIGSNQRLGLAAASRAIWTKLKPTETAE